MKISRRSVLKKIGAFFGSASLLGFSTPVGNNNTRLNLPGELDFNVKDYGAKADGKTDDTKAINHTIATAAQAGGGRVYFPAGTYRTGSIHLDNNISLYLEQGSTLEATDNPDSYDDPEPLEGKQYQDFGHSHWHNSLIWGENLENITICGPGMIYGKGLLRDVRKNDPRSKQEMGNKSIALKKCRNVTLKDFTIKHAGHFSVLATGVDNLTVDNLAIDTNRDGINIDCCRNVRISNCAVNSPRDDAIVPKSSYALGYARATQDVTITNCTISGYKEGTLLDGTYRKNTKRTPPVGRIKFGTESNGGFKNITISNCTFEHCRGLEMETVDGGLLEDISISNITMRDVKLTPIFMRLGSRMRGPKNATAGELRRINISNVVVHNADEKTGVVISGIPDNNIKDLKINNVQIQYEGGGSKEDAAISPAEKADSYPDPSMFGKMPSYGFYLRHVEGIEMTNIHLTYIDDEARPAFVLKDVKEADFRFIKARHEPNIPVFSLNNVEEFRLFESHSLENMKLGSVDQKKI